LTVYGYCLEKFDLGHYWDLKEIYIKFKKTELAEIS